MADDAPSLKRTRSENEKALSLSSLTLDGLLEERVRFLVAQALSSLSPSSTIPLAEASMYHEALAQCRSEIALQKQEIANLKDAQAATNSLVQALQKSITGLKANSVQSEQTIEARDLGGESAGNLTLKVGSRKFQTTVDTLRCFPDSFFDLMVSGRIPQKCEKDGSIFIDRNPKHFSFVLDYLRSGGDGFTPPSSSSAQDELRVEADFYGLPGLVTVLRRLHVASHHLMTVGKKGAVLSGHKHSAAMLDVQDPNNFSVTFGTSSFSTDYPFFIGLAPLDTCLASEWVESLAYKNLECPPALEHGLFFSVKNHNAGLATASGSKLSLAKTKDWRHWPRDQIESVKVCFHRNNDICKVTFHIMVKYERTYNGQKNHTIKWDTNILDHSLPLDKEYRPAVFLRESGTITIIEMTNRS